MQRGAPTQQVRVEAGRPEVNVSGGLITGANIVTNRDGKVQPSLRRKRQQLAVFQRHE